MNQKIITLTAITMFVFAFGLLLFVIIGSSTNITNIPKADGSQGYICRVDKEVHGIAQEGHIGGQYLT